MILHDKVMVVLLMFRGQRNLKGGWWWWGWW